MASPSLTSVGRSMILVFGGEGSPVVRPMSLVADRDGQRLRGGALTDGPWHPASAVSSPPSDGAGGT